MTFLSLMGSLSTLSQKADCCVLSGLQPFRYERPAPLPSSSHHWAQWLFSHLVKGVFHVQAGFLIRKVAHSLEVPLFILCLLDLSSFEAGEGSRALLPPSTHTTHMHKHSFSRGCTLGVCSDVESFFLGILGIRPFPT